PNSTLFPYTTLFRSKINDEGNNALVLDGNILTETYRNFKFGLNIKGNDFKIVSSEKDESAILYGIMAVDADLNIRGDLNLPKIEDRKSTRLNSSHVK